MLVKLHRPPPEIRIFFPILSARSSRATRRPRLPHWAAHIKPAAPAPRITTSYERIKKSFRQEGPVWHRTSQSAKPQFTVRCIVKKKEAKRSLRTFGLCCVLTKRRLIHRLVNASCYCDCAKPEFGRRKGRMVNSSTAETACRAAIITPLRLAQTRATVASQVFCSIYMLAIISAMAANATANIANAANSSRTKYICSATTTPKNNHIHFRLLSCFFICFPRIIPYLLSTQTYCFDASPVHSFVYLSYLTLR